MTPNPVCYNGLNLPKDAIHMRSVSLGIRPKNYRADTAQRWRSGINPSGAVVLYSNTFYLGLTTEEVADPRIWWTDPASSVADFKLKINELLSRLPERAANNYQVFADYDEAIDWLSTTSEGKYALVNDNYPEYYIPGEYCLFNVETGLLASYPASGLNIYNLANPNSTVGNQLNQYALSWNGFTISNATGDLNIGLIGQEPGLAYNTTGHIISIDDLPKEAYLSNNLVFEAVINIVYSQSSCVFNLIDSSTMADVLRVDWDASTEQFVAYYSGLGSIIRFGQVTTPWVGDIHLIISVPATNDPNGIGEAAVVVDGVTYKVSSITGSSYQLENTTFFQIGNNADLNSPIHKLKSAKAYSVPLDSVSTVLDELVSINTLEVKARY